MSGIIARMLGLRARSLREGWMPRAVEIGPSEFRALADQNGLGSWFCGMEVRCVERDGLTILALPNRRIGRYEVVVPTRIEERADEPEDPSALTV